MKATCRRKMLPKEPNCKSKTKQHQDLRTGSNGENPRLDVFLAKLNPPKIGIAEFVCLGLVCVVVPALSEEHKKGSYEHHTKYGENQKSLHPSTESHSQRI